MAHFHYWGAIALSPPHVYSFTTLTVTHRGKHCQREGFFDGWKEEKLYHNFHPEWSIGNEVTQEQIGVGFKAEFFDWILNWMKQIFIFAIRKFIPHSLYSELFWVHSAINWRLYVLEIS